jgi:hypothetical protein
MVAHRRKSSGDFADDGVLGSRAFTGIARAVWHLSRDPDDKSRRLLLPGKNNLTPEGDGLAFRIEGNPGRIVWEDGPVRMTADDAQFAEARVAAQKRKPGPAGNARRKAADWLCQELTTGPKAVADLKVGAESAGHKWRTVERAADDLCVVSDRTGFAGGAVWRLPETQAVDGDAQSRQDNPDGSRPALQEGENLATWRECENPQKTPDSTTTPAIPATPPESGEAVAKSKPKSRRRRKAAPTEPELAAVMTADSSDPSEAG